jgi:hypothetical protein
MQFVVRIIQNMRIQNAELFDVKIDGAYSDHCDLKSRSTFGNVSSRHQKLQLKYRDSVVRNLFVRGGYTRLRCSWH